MWGPFCNVYSPNAETNKKSKNISGSSKTKTKKSNKK